ncbi:MAG TPA: hypothetical protein DIU15_20085 [Deltaproteobacteria bacterium]|nr:hypothetical protein [Deltaproteobacteria bacterium]
MPSRSPDLRNASYVPRFPRDQGSGNTGRGNDVCEPSPDANPPVASALHIDSRNFYFREDITEESGRTTRGATLRALGDHIAIYVDNETPIDTDLDCDDPDNEIQASDLPAEGFNNCHLEQVVDVFEQNIYPNLTTLFGEAADVNQDCVLTVLISHRMNGLTLTNGDPSDDARVVKSFTEPGIDLWERNVSLNPGSNEQDILFLYAPDPLGFWSDQQVSLDGYLNFEVAGRLAMAFQDLISYTAKREVEDELLDPASPDDIGRPPTEDDWLKDAMGLLAADITGFGAISYTDAWEYMDSSYLLTLISNNTLEDFGDRGGQYLFARYLHDLYGDDIIWQIVHSEDAEGEQLLDQGGSPTRGTETIAALTEVDEFAEFALQWAGAMAVSGKTNDAGGQLVFDSVLPNYKTSSTVIVENPAEPEPGELWGANGFQLGFNVHGYNRTHYGGTSPTGPVEDESVLIKTENLDPLLFHPLTDFYGSMAGNFGVATVIVSGLQQAENSLLLETQAGEELLGYVVRLTDYQPSNPPLTLEDVDGAKITTVRYLGELDPQGSERYVIGRIDPAEDLDVTEPVEPPEGDDDDDDDSAAAGDDGGGVARDDDDAGDGGGAGDDDDSATEEMEYDIRDTDRYGFSLSSTTTMGIWVDRRVSTLEGAAALADSWVAVALQSDVPDSADYSMWNFGPNPSDGICSDPTLFYYPLIMPTWVAAQGNLKSDPVVGTFEPKVGSDPGSIACEYDHDQDGLADVDEAQPGNLQAQILQRQAENLAANPNFYLSSFGSLPDFPPITEPFWDARFIDVDSNEVPDDAFASAFMADNIGGRAVEGGEEAVWRGTLPPGDYIILVGGVGETGGTYDLSVRVLTGQGG